MDLFFVKKGKIDFDELDRLFKKILKEGFELESRLKKKQKIYPSELTNLSYYLNRIKETVEKGKPSRFFSDEEIKKICGHPQIEKIFDKYLGPSTDDEKTEAILQLIEIIKTVKRGNLKKACPNGQSKIKSIAQFLFYPASFKKGAGLTLHLSQLITFLT